jgi:hypothetical protein
MARGKTNSINGSQAVATKAARGKAAPGKAASGRNGAGKKTAGKSKKARANTGANGYRPSEGEPFMNPRMREYFRRKLLDWKADEETEEPIALRRLEARPIATLSLEAQERHERMERTHRDE